jgi:hypothetical protein
MIDFKELLSIADHAVKNQMGEWAAFHRTFTPDVVAEILRENTRLVDENAELHEEVGGLYAELDFITSRSWEGRF